MKYIYALIDPRDRSVRYVGQTDNMDRRCTQHINTNEDTPKGAWVIELRRLGLAPTMVQLERVDNDRDTGYREKWWIIFGQRHGWQLTNSANPSVKAVSFGEMFSAQLAHDYELFSSNLRDQSPFLLITRSQIQTAFTLLKLIVAVTIGSVTGLASWYFEYGLSNNTAAAIWQGVTMGLSMATLVAIVLTNNIRRGWFALTYAGLWFLACTYLIWWR
jgi:hypothetical protein